MLSPAVTVSVQGVDIVARVTKREPMTPPWRLYFRYSVFWRPGRLIDTRGAPACGCRRLHRATQTSWYNLRVNGRLNGNGLSITPQIRDDDELKAGLDNYPPLSRKLHQEGDCVVRVTVESNGTPSNVNVTKSTGYAPLDKACLSAVQQAHFVPARQEGKTLAASTDININWRLPSP
jgi:TonB family protein